MRSIMTELSKEQTHIHVYKDQITAENHIGIIYKKGKWVRFKNTYKDTYSAEEMDELNEIIGDVKITNIPIAVFRNCYRVQLL